MFDQVKTILLDLGGVVFQSTGVSNELIHWDKIALLNDKYGHDLNVGIDCFSDFLFEYNSMTYQQLEEEEFLEAVFDTLEMNNALVDGLKEKYDIMIVSDNYRENIAYISKRYHFDLWAKEQYYSFDFGTVKTDPAFFTQLIQKINRPVESLLFIDDSQEKLDCAAELGILGIRFSTNESVFSKLI